MYLTYPMLNPIRRHLACRQQYPSFDVGNHKLWVFYQFEFELAHDAIECLGNDALIGRYAGPRLLVLRRTS